MRTVWSIALLVVLFVIHVFALGKLDRLSAVGKTQENPLYVLPSPIMKIVALDYDGIIADFLFIEGIAYIGGNIQGKQQDVHIVLSEWQWIWFYRLMDVASDLDPYFQDPYFLANAFLTWDAGMVQEANSLLEKGSRSRVWDWRLPFFIGFNYFYLLEENEKASQYLMEAYRRPKGSPVLASIASKLAYKSKRTETAILFIEEMLEKTDDALEKRQFTARLESLKAIQFLDNAVQQYKTTTNRIPFTLEALVTANIIKSIPPDPLGGRFYLDSNGIVKTTSEYLLMPAQRQYRR
jgi:hypothetical protein